jgi:hypothetical protein
MESCPLKFRETDLVEVVADNADLGIGMIINHRYDYYCYEIYLFKGNYSCWFAEGEVFEPKF